MMPQPPPSSATASPPAGMSAQDLKRDMAYPILGRIAIKNGLLTRDQLRQAISEMYRSKASGTPQTLEEVLLSGGYIQAASMEKLLASTLRSLDRQFCSTALEMKLLDSESCETALQEQAQAYREGRLLAVGDILIQKEKLSPEKRDLILMRMRENKTDPHPPASPSLLEKLQEEERRRQITGSSRKIPAEEMAIARMALQYHFITTEQLQNAILYWNQQQKNEKPPSLSVVLETLGFVGRKEISLLHATRLFYETRQMDQLFGRLCVIHQYCTQEDILRALETQLAKFKRNKTIKLLGNILVEAGVLSHKQMISVLREQKRIPSAPTPSQAPPSTPQQTSSQENPALPVPADAGVLVEIDMEGMTAQLIPAPELSRDMDIAGLKQLIKDAGVLFGGVSDKTLQAYLDNTQAHKEAFPVARGIAPTEPVDGYIRYGFDPDHLKAGKIDADGKIDYFDRGETPFTKAHSLLAERIPPQKGKPGMKVTGEASQPREPKDVELRAGSGAELSLDGQMIYALIDGQPQATLGGKISVFPEMGIEGNVDPKTGHVLFHGAIRIRGSVQPGFCVKAASATAITATKADIEVSGDLVIQDGIIGSKVRAGGTVQAKFIIDSEIFAFGNILVEKEIINSVIRTSGALILPRGKLIASEAAARGGMEIYEVGTEASSSCTLFIGIDFRVQNETLRLNEEKETLKQEMEQIQKNITKEEGRQVDLHREIAEKAQLQDETHKIIAKLYQEIKQDTPKTEALVQQIKNLEAIILSAEKTVEALFTEQDSILDTILENQEKMEKLSKKIEENSWEYRSLQDWNKSNPPSPVLKLKGPMMPGTRITGPKSQMTVNERVRNVIFNEIQVSSYNGEPSWMIRMQNK